MDNAESATARGDEPGLHVDGTSDGPMPAPQTDGDLGDLLQELRVLLQGVQVLTGFLIVLPFSEGFVRVSEGQRTVYLILFLCVLLSLVLFSAPAAQHRLLTPLRDRIQFKRGATRMVIGGMVPFSVALVLATHFVLDEVAGRLTANIASGAAALCIFVLWWIAPLLHRRHYGV
jgi:hypothetical protein